MKNELELRIIEVIQSNPDNLHKALEPLAKDFDTTVSAVYHTYRLKIKPLIGCLNLRGIKHSPRQNVKNSYTYVGKWTEEEDKYLAHCIKELGTRRGYLKFSETSPRSLAAISVRYALLKKHTNLFN